MLKRSCGLWVLGSLLVTLSVSSAEENHRLLKEISLKMAPAPIYGVEERVFPPGFRESVTQIYMSQMTIEEKQRDLLHHLAVTEERIEEAIPRYDLSGISLVIEKYWQCQGNSQEFGQKIQNGLPPEVLSQLIFHIYLQYWQLKLLITNPHYFRLNPYPHVTLTHAMHYYMFFQALLHHTRLQGHGDITQTFDKKTIKIVEDGKLNYYFGNLKVRGENAREYIGEAELSHPIDDSFRILAVFQSFIERDRGDALAPKFSFAHVGPSIHMDRKTLTDPHSPPLAARIFRTALYTEYISSGTEGENLRWVIDPFISSLPLPLPLWRIIVSRSLANYGLAAASSTSLEAVATPSNLPPVIHDILDTRVQIGIRTNQKKITDGAPGGFDQKSMEQWKDGILPEDTFEQQGGTAMAPEELGKMSQEFIPVYDDDPLIDAQEFDRTLRLKQNMSLEEFNKLSRLYREFYRLKGNIFSVHMAHNIVHDSLKTTESKLIGNLNFLHIPAEDLKWMATWLAFLSDELDLIIKILERNVGGSSHLNRYDLLADTFQETGYLILSVKNFFIERGCKLEYHEAHCKIAFLLYTHPDINLAQEFETFLRETQLTLHTSVMEKLVVLRFTTRLRSKYEESSGTTVGCFAIPPDMADDMKKRMSHLLARGLRIAREHLHLDREAFNAEDISQKGDRTYRGLDHSFKAPR